MTTSNASTPNGTKHLLHDKSSRRSYIGSFAQENSPQYSEELWPLMALYQQDTVQKGEAANYSRLKEMVRWYVEQKRRDHIVNCPQRRQVSGTRRKPQRKSSSAPEREHAKTERPRVKRTAWTLTCHRTCVPASKTTHNSNKANLTRLHTVDHRETATNFNGQERIW